MYSVIARRSDACLTKIIFPRHSSLIERISTRQLFTEKLPRQEQAIRRKLDDRSILPGLEPGLRDGDIRLPKGIVTGVQLETVLRGLVKDTLLGPLYLGYARAADGNHSACLYLGRP